MADDDIASVVLNTVPGLLDTDSLKVDWNWDRSRFTNEAEGARTVIKALDILQVCLCTVFSHAKISCLQLSVVQSSNSGATTMPIVDECLRFHISYLPPETSKILYWEPAFSIHNPSQLFDFGLDDAQLQQKNDEFYKDHQQFFDNVARATWTILPLAVNGHFSAVILHAKKKRMPGTTRGYRTVIRNAVIVEPEKNAEVERFMWDRLRVILSVDRGFTFKHRQAVKLWFPKQYDTNTCGFRVYEVMRVMMMRISQSVAEEGLKDGYNPEYIWQDLSGMYFLIYVLFQFLFSALSQKQAMDRLAIVPRVLNTPADSLLR